jgi:hypothetical protein
MLLLIFSDQTTIGAWQISNYHYFAPCTENRNMDNVCASRRFLKQNRLAAEIAKLRKGDSIPTPIFYAHEETGRFFVLITQEDAKNAYIDLFEERPVDHPAEYWQYILYQSILPAEWSGIFVRNEHFRVTSPYPGNKEGHDNIFFLSNPGRPA